MIYQSTPPYPGRIPLPKYRVKQNSFVQAAINYYIVTELRGAGVKIVPAWALTMPWCDEELSGHTHMIDAVNGKLITIPPADVASYYAMELACRDGKLFNQ